VQSHATLSSIRIPKLSREKNKSRKRNSNKMCGVLFTLWVGRKNNGAIEQSSNSNVRGSAINTRVVKLAPVKAKDTENPKPKPDEEEALNRKIEDSKLAPVGESA